MELETDGWNPALGKITCEVTGNRLRSILPGGGLEIPCVYTSKGKKKIIEELTNILLHLNFNILAIHTHDVDMCHALACIVFHFLWPTAYWPCTRLTFCRLGSLIRPPSEATRLMK